MLGIQDPGGCPWTVTTMDGSPGGLWKTGARVEISIHLGKNRAASDDASFPDTASHP